MKRVISLVLLSVLMISAFSSIALAEVHSSIYTRSQIEELTRTKLAIEKEMKLENANLHTRDTRRQQLWNLNFSRENEGMYVSITADTGEITSFHRWENDSYGKPFRILPDEAKATAIAFIQSLEAEKYQETEEVTVEAPSMIIFDLLRSNYQDNNYYFMFARKINGEFVPNHYFRVQVSGTTGNVTQYEMNWDEAVYDNQKSFISEAAARAVFEKEDRFALKYVALYNNNREERSKPLLTPVYIYSPKESDKINAVDGRLYRRDELYIPWDNYYYPRYAAGMEDMAAKEMAAYDGGREVIPEEGVISKERVERDVLQTLGRQLDIQDLRVEHSSYSNHHFGLQGKYWSVYWSDQNTDKSLWTTVDAENGDILAVNYSRQLKEREVPEVYRSENMKMEAAGRMPLSTYPEELAIAHTDEIKEKENQSEIKIDESKVIREVAEKIQAIFPQVKEREIKLEVESLIAEDSLVHLHSMRYIDNIPYEANHIHVTYQYTTGEIIRLDYRWNQVEAQPASQVKDKRTIEKKFYDTVGFERYLVQLKDKAAAERAGLDIPLKELVPVYSIKGFGFSYIDAITGKLLDYNGDEYQEEALITSEFQDIRNHPYENEIILMSKMGILKEENQSFLPNNDLLRRDAIKWIVEMGWRGRYYYIDTHYLHNQQENRKPFFKDVDEEDPYYPYVQAAVESGILEKDEEYFKPHEKVSKIQVTTWLLNAMEQKELAQFTEIFQVTYSDSEAIREEDTGYVALAKYYNIFGDKEGKGVFQPDKALKRGEFVSILYHFLVNQ
ncbi:S-layer homology domain-containing protein [Natronincola peptidivorans]|uniref:S-layer homology domain-containing protein n=1 Tax=Natronincola peptidivorans TaxID=426128 RepID=A0A1I0H2J6_9FIRM|nr:S-layer homology domain-containing protein [Natronincola peptidivorans]SET76912.1 S-layer homology domain-containing protein [Natronincola peptidivorans]